MKNILAAFTVLLALSACGEKEAQPVSEQPSAPAAEAARAADPSYKPNEKTYFKLAAVAGGELDLAAYSGKPVMVMFFTETCPYCRKAAPFVEKVHKAYGEKGLSVLGICIQDSKQAALNFASDLGVTFPLAYSGRETYMLYKAQGVPYIYLLDKTHQVKKFWAGYTPEYDQSIFETVDAVLAS